MSNFLNFIEEDIETKNMLITSLPAKSKSDIRKYNEKIDDITSKYLEYKKGVNAYITTKSKSFEVKPAPTNIDALHEQITALEHVKFVLNPTNTYVEKIGFDNLFYEISNYYEFNFNSLNIIINNFIDKFELAGINLTSESFNYTTYVHEYMSAFLDVRHQNAINYDKVSKIFEKIYWVNPEIIEHLELNFRKLVRFHHKSFDAYITHLQKKVMEENKVTGYNDCLEKLKSNYFELAVTEKENITDIVNLAKTGEISIANYFEDSKFRSATYTNITIDPLDLSNEKIMAKFYHTLEKLKSNVEEYSNYLKFLPLIAKFKKQYEKQLDTSSKEYAQKLKSIEGKIISQEAKLDKINKQLFTGKIGLLKQSNDAMLKLLKIDSMNYAKGLAVLYNEYDAEYFNSKVFKILSTSLTIPDVLHLYYSFDYFKKSAIKEVFNVSVYDEILKYSESFDLFAMNLTNVIVHGIDVFASNNIDKVIINKYRFDNVNLTEEDLSEDELPVLLEKIKFLLRINEINNSGISVEKIWFINQVEKIVKAESTGK